MATGLWVAARLEHRMHLSVAVDPDAQGAADAEPRIEPERINVGFEHPPRRKRRASRS